MPKKYFLKSIFGIAAIGIAYFWGQTLLAELPLPASMGAYNGESIYRFSNELQNAETWMADDQEKFTKGTWENDKFVFGDFGPRAEILTVEEAIEGEDNKNAIRYNPILGSSRYLRYINVPSGSKMLFSYNIKAKSETEKYSYLDFKIWQGSHLLRQFRIPVQEVDYIEEFPLGVVSFLDRPMIITFEIFTASSDKSFFDFSAEILR